MVGMMNQRTWIGRLLVVGVLGAAAAGAIAPTASSPSTVLAADSALGAGGEFHPLTPTRIFDTRGAGIADTAPLGRKPTGAAGKSFDVGILGRGGIPAAANDVLAVVLNVTVSSPSLGGYLAIAPKGSNAGVSSLVNFDPGEAVPNMAIIGVGSGGQATVSLFTPAGVGSADVLIDVFGWISTSSFVDGADTGARLMPVNPTRALDTRSSPVPAGWTSGRPVGAMEQVTLPIRGANGIVPPGPDVTGVMVNITAVNNLAGSTGTFISATPAPTPAGAEPTTSVTNVSVGQVKANMAVVPLGADGSIRLFNRFGSTHLIVDILGYLQQGVADTSTTGRVIPLDAPFRAFDTRQVAFGSQPLGYGTKEPWSFQAFADSVLLGGQTIGSQSALIGNLTGTGLAPLAGGSNPATYLTVYPGVGDPPNSSNINVTVGKSVPNMSLLRYGSAGGDPYTISAYNYEGTLHYLLDVYAVVLS